MLKAQRIFGARQSWIKRILNFDLSRPQFVVGKLFKDGMCDAWADWMLNESQKFGTTPAGNYKHPTYPDCLQWASKVWNYLNTEGVVKKAKQLGMCAEPGPEIEGFIDQQFQDEQPIGEVVEVEDPEFGPDLQ